MLLLVECAGWLPGKLLHGDRLCKLISNIIFTRILAYVNFRYFLVRLRWRDALQVGEQDMVLPENSLLDENLFMSFLLLILPGIARR